MSYTPEPSHCLRSHPPRPTRLDVARVTKCTLQRPPAAPGPLPTGHTGPIPRAHPSPATSEHWNLTSSQSSTLFPASLHVMHGFCPLGKWSPLSSFFVASFHFSESFSCFLNSAPPCGNANHLILSLKELRFSKASSTPSQRHSSWRPHAMVPFLPCSVRSLPASSCLPPSLLGSGNGAREPGLTQWLYLVPMRSHHVTSLLPLSRDRRC